MHPDLIKTLEDLGYDDDALVNASSVLIKSFMSKYSREADLEFGFWELDGDPGKIEVECRLKLRCCIDNSARIQKYLEILTESLAAVNVEVLIYPPRTIALRGVVDEGQDEEYQADFDELIEFVMQHYIGILFSASAMIRLSTRLSKRGGTEQYRKLLPSRLVMLSVHGHFDSELTVQ